MFKAFGQFFPGNQPSFSARFARRWILGSVILAALLASTSAASAQNLLINGHLEGVDGFPIPPGSCAKPGNWYYAYNCIPEIEPPTWWYPFWNSGPSAVDPNTNYRRPEYRVYSWPDGPHYAYQGQRYLVFFGFFGAIDAGMYQRVGVTPGQLYEFSYQAFAWSNCLDGKQGASGDGCGNFPTYQAVFKAGIDPTGGTDYTSPNIVWSSGDSIYDAYDLVSITTTAGSSTITAFVRCTFWHNYIQHNDAHVDALQLVRIPPRIALSTSQLANTIWIGDPSPDNDVFTIANGTGTGTMNYTVTDNADWLNVAPTSGSSAGEADEITVSYDVTGLPARAHAATITVTSGDVDNSPQTVAVTLTIQTVGPDLDGDADVDLNDFGLFQRCFSGAGTKQEDPDCFNARLDQDEDVDQEDFDIFKGCMSGTNVPANRDCEP